MLSYTDATTGATPLAIMKTAIKTGDASVLNQLPDALSLLFGATGDTFGAGTTGEVCAFALLLGLAYEENHHLAYSCQYHRYSIRIQRFDAFG